MVLWNIHVFPPDHTHRKWQMAHYNRLKVAHYNSPLTRHYERILNSQLLSCILSQFKKSLWLKELVKWGKWKWKCKQAVSNNSQVSRLANKNKSAFFLIHHFPTMFNAILMRNGEIVDTANIRVRVPEVTQHICTVTDRRVLAEGRRSEH